MCMNGFMKFKQGMLEGLDKKGHTRVCACYNQQKKESTYLYCESWENTHTHVKPTLSTRLCCWLWAGFVKILCKYCVYKAEQPRWAAQKPSEPAPERVCVFCSPFATEPLWKPDWSRRPQTSSFPAGLGVSHERWCRSRRGEGRCRAPRRTKTTTFTPSRQGWAITQPAGPRGLLGSLCRPA